MDLFQGLASTSDSPSDEELARLHSQLMQENSKVSEKTDALQEKVVPTPGCCLQTKNSKTNQKAFINVCMSNSVPSPREITEKELKELVESLEDENAIVDYRVPMSIGEPHAEVDEGNMGCTVYDVIINPAYYKKIRGSEIFFGFFMSIVIEGIFNKYEVQLELNWILLKEKKFIGSLQEQCLRKKRLIEEISQQTTTPIEKPKFKIYKEPVQDHPQFLIAEINLPKVNRAKPICVDIGEDRLVLSVKPSLYELDIYLPFKLIQHECGSQFNVKTKILTVTMPVQPL